MAVWIDPTKSHTTDALIGQVIMLGMTGQRVSFLTDPGAGSAVVQRMRVALSRSRARNKARGRAVSEFTLKHEIYPYTKDGKRHDCVVMWIQKFPHHSRRELLDDILNRSEPTGVNL